MLIQGKLLSQGNDLAEVLFIRRKVFIDEMKIPESVEYDGLDDLSMHVIVYEEARSKRAVATGRISFDGQCCEISRIAVLKEYRNKQYGDFAVRMLLNKAFTSGIHVVMSRVNSESVEFFKKIGFHIMDKDIGNKDLAHYTMEITVQDIKYACHKEI
jgi:N-acetylglutamate synthase-like GNAT family acetyltransferase